MKIPELQVIGNVEILRARVYAMDPMTRVGIGWVTEAVVGPGKYPLFELGFTRFWMMNGEITLNSFRLGDGMGMLVPDDTFIPGLVVRFPSRSYGPDEWRAFLDEPMCKEGPEQKLAVTLYELVDHA